ncbi:CDP-diacylglycerol--glycerol-3-phosphate 3-phosphatidyltransferase [Actinoplanes campanulatus]|uniref:CDP-diacylglycerol--glycerol-3-phosphate 3-phosphatidyltransferase n=1 Tax=Actinoplanes campanulatus TaxID=113559 RepID=A0A7W5AB70_9ACTN|nr:CDP-diacylglycerol--glycerol-3-phosphate 3-phosphatidyltransferase [Actinoplanes campanulatus]MBB3093033.1 CDP-diacylglycerol--glycerol-3-phosphate 3-phosphatidyltransferase [Actinoplanes campanulatus]GGN00726.1 CDP-diacylglycerol--glycerol-3-phosphate 3-phosphatidyltransferase [Actinoplanes campanulatus]GID33870.1 CDP-diacylglycerol--glycerol-3-phosphate 3-phosphatidyltransferase [Actinoplanes campanulatus]
MTDEPVPAPAARVVSLYNAANALTVVRIVLVPVFLFLVVVSEMTRPDWRIAACLAFCIASATDFADGWIARRWSLVTSFGKIADPIADKALTGTALVLLSFYGALPWWVTVVILVREWGVTALRFWVIRYGVIPASRGGKLKTGLQTVAIAWYLWPVPEPFHLVGVVLMGAALVVTVVTGADYVVQALRLRRGAVS